MFKKAGLFLLAIILAMNMCGCAALVIGALGGIGTATWFSGKLSAEVDASFEDTIEAVKSALKSMDLAVTKETTTKDITQIMTAYSDRTTTWIDIHPLTQSRSKIEIRVGVTGNKANSQKIMERIKKYL